jgi:hypothetical protein
MNLKFTYVRDTPIGRRQKPDGEWEDIPSPRVATIGRVVDHDQVHFAVVVNKIVDPAEYRLDPRIRQVMEPGAFRVLQKKFRRRFGGDNHCKKAARSILAQRISAEQHHTIPYRQDHVVEDIMRFVAEYQAAGIPTPASNICFKALNGSKEA